MTEWANASSCWRVPVWISDWWFGGDRTRPSREVVACSAAIARHSHSAGHSVQHPPRARIRHDAATTRCFRFAERRELATAAKQSLR